FHLPRDRKNDGQENMLILRINDQVYGTIVDKIDKVVGVNRETIQPPHPIFGDINIKYISGVVEKTGELYVILDVIRIFGQKEEGKEKEMGTVSSTGDFFVPPPTSGSALAEQVKAMDVEGSTLGFLKEGLAALKRFNVAPLNENWMRRRFTEWNAMRTNADLQLRNAADADEFLSNFFSQYTGTFWGEDYAMEVKSVLPKLSSNSIQAWEIGCGKGYETFSFACILKSRYPDAQIKVWANDNDIMSISQAPNMTFALEQVPEYCHPFMVKGKNGYSFSQAVKDSIVFEYHDVLNDNPLPSLDLILARDTLSFFTEQDQSRLIESFAEKLKSQGMVIMGRNEELPGGNWVSVSNEFVSAFTLGA
ncbi:MAG: chemotaxis protein CheW, partial [Treponema sp.]|nr:chemotaxis protein CheW [Treponema sp.]